MMSGTPSEPNDVPGWYIKFQTAVIEQLPRPGEINKTICEDWRGNQQGLKLALFKTLVPPGPRRGDTVSPDYRNMRSMYPEWMEPLPRSVVEGHVRASYDLADVEQFVLPDQSRGAVTSIGLHHFLSAEQRLDHCLNIADLVAIRSLGVHVFRAHFGMRSVYFWGSLAKGFSDQLYVPVLAVLGRMHLDWEPVDHRTLGRDCVTLRFKSSS